MERPATRLDCILPPTPLPFLPTRFFQTNKFYAFAAPDGSVVMRWFEQVPAGWVLLGRVHYVTLPYTEKTGTFKSGWMEVDEDD
jgi:hypothetical protein